MWRTTRKQPLPPPRVLDNEDISSWFIAADSRRRPTFRDAAEAKEYFKSRYPYRWSRLRCDSRWATRKLMKQMGLTEEDAKSFLWWSL